ncbi:MAG: UDP-N-acetylmuramoyl-L-alanine--D-glutamate ligase [Selenomonadaceae bacterium]
MDFANKKMLVIGAGISGIAAAKLAKKMGADVVVSDTKEEQKIKYDLKSLRDCGVNVVLGEQQESLLTGMDYVLVSPAVPIAVPIVQKAKKIGIEVLSEIEMAYRLAKAPIYAVTGTNGKTTTVTLLGLLMQTLHEKVGVGGNIGMPLCDEVMRVGSKGCTVAEISSYQLEGVSSFNPHIAAILNVTPDHIARHGSIENYQKVKETIFCHQTKEDYLVLNYDDSRTRSMADRARSTVAFFSCEEVLKEGAFVRDGWITIIWMGQMYRICSVEELKIKGSHNIENALAAVMVAFLAGVDISMMSEVLKTFAGVEHRIEPVMTIDNVMYYNDSKATNPESAIKALGTFSGHIVLIAGGDDKNTDLTAFMQLVYERVDQLILVGNATARFKENAIKNGFLSDHIHEAGYSMEDAVALAHRLARSPQIVLLSPACASFDMFDGYEERGRVFKNLVKNLQ